MKVLELCLSNGFGGLELYAFRAACQLVKRDVACFPVIRKATLLDERFAKSGIKTTYLRVRNRFLPLQAAKSLAKFIDTHAIDVIHLHWGKDLVLAVLAKRFSKRQVRLVYTRQMALTRNKHDFFHQFLYRHVDTYLTITRKLQEDARRFLPMPAKDIQLLYYGVPEPEPGGQECDVFLRQAGFSENAFRIGLFGRIEHGKGQHLLAEATRILAGQGYNIESLLVGYVMDQSYFDGLMEQMQQAGLASRYRYYGFHEKPTAIMSCFDVVVLTTYAETFGLVLVEAMRAGTAVVGSNAGGVPEIIESEKTGMLFEPGNAEDLALAIEKLIKDESLRQRLASAGKVFADLNFDENTHFDRLVEFLAGD